MITMYFGSPGSGKTTLANRLLFLHQMHKRYSYYYANFETALAKYVPLGGLGHWTLPPGSLLIIDEAGIEYNNRKFKTMDQTLIQWLKLHRHYEVDVVILSQSWEDVDITLRRLTDHLYHIRKLGPFTLVRRVYKGVGIDKQTHQIMDFYRFGFFLGFLVGLDNFSIFWRPTYYRYFDTLAAPPLTSLPAADPPAFRWPVFYALRHPLSLLAFIGNAALHKALPKGKRRS